LAEHSTMTTLASKLANVRAPYFGEHSADAVAHTSARSVQLTTKRLERSLMACATSSVAV
jgi:hypothetical protein